MAEFEDKLSSILGNPELMGQIMSMAGSLGQSQSPPPPPPPQSPLPGLDPGAMQNMMQLLKSTQISPKEQNLLRALEGYLPPDRLQKLTRAMQASGVARYASSAFPYSSRQTCPSSKANSTKTYLEPFNVSNLPDFIFSAISSNSFS